MIWAQTSWWLSVWLLAWWLPAVSGTCPLTGPRASPTNIMPPNADPESGSVLMRYNAWNASNLSIEMASDLEEASGYLSLVFDGPEGGGSLQAGESFSDMDEYVLRRIRISMPSEHTLLHRHLPLEVQLWHESAVHRDISRLITERARVQQMLHRFHGLIQDWQFQLKRLEDPSARNVSFPNLQTERDWAEAVRSDSIHDGESLMEHAGQLRHQIARIDEEVEVLNERLQRPQSARMVALSLLYTAPQDAVLAASGHFLRWLAGTIKRKQERPKPETEDQAALQAEVQQLQHRLDEMQGQKDEFEGTPERQLQSGPEGQQETPEVFHFEEFHSFGKDAVRDLPLTALAYEGSFTKPPCTPVVRWYLVSEPQAATAQDVLSLAATVLGSGESPMCHRVQGLEVCNQGISPSDGVWWNGPIKEVPESQKKFPNAFMNTVSLGFGSFHKPQETHLSSQLVSRLPWVYVQACCAVLLLCSIAMLGVKVEFCYGNQDFVVTYNQDVQQTVGLMTASFAGRYEDGLSLSERAVLQQTVPSGVGDDGNTSNMYHGSLIHFSDGPLSFAKDSVASMAVVAEELPSCLDADNWLRAFGPVFAKSQLSRFHSAAVLMGRDNATSCAELADKCEDWDSRLLRGVCGRTCGCHLPSAMTWFKVPEQGCPTMCRGEATALAKEIPCEDAPITDEWQSFWDKYPDIMSRHLGVNLSSPQAPAGARMLRVFVDFMKATGCPGLLSAPDEIITRTTWCTGNQYVAPLAHICPVSCGCRVDNPPAHCPQSCKACGDTANFPSGSGIDSCLQAKAFGICGIPDHAVELCAGTCGLCSGNASVSSVCPDGPLPPFYGLGSCADIKAAGWCPLLEFLGSSVRLICGRSCGACT
ncbi:rsph10b [Symbiodinium natans]|uniref:carbonic anhydrase n=1 Tax=Symbiodinium natans TaxID=878477 RepID=A0A812MN63_9DINO|nr:rsph10b [Symbiodinium natans]